MATPRRPIQHVDRKDLYTNLEARILYLHTFLDFSSRDIEALVSGSKYIKALIPAVVTIVYRKLLQYDITARAFETRSTSFEGPMDAAPDENSPQVLHRKMFLRAYLNKICSDPSQMEFWEYLDKVGMMHVGLGREHPLHVEYIHIGAALSVIQDILTEAILSHPRLHLSRKVAIVKALGKVIWIQNDLFAKWYVRDGDEYRTETPEVVIEQEGYLHGKKILEEDEDGDGDGDGDDGAGRPPPRSSAGASESPAAPVREAGVCPFSGMARGMEGLRVAEAAADKS